MSDSKIKNAVSALIGAGTALWGWFGWLIIVWVVAMGLDYLTGTMAALKDGEWNSQRARDGLWHKAGMILAVAVAGIADLALGLIVRQTGVALPFEYGTVIAPLVISWYCLTELGSVLENAVALGASVPGWLRKLLKISAESVDKRGEGMLPGEEEK